MNNLEDSKNIKLRITFETLLAHTGNSADICGKPPVAFGQIWHIRPTLLEWLGPNDMVPVLFPVVVIESGLRIGTLTACKVLCIHELSGSACADDLLLDESDSPDLDTNAIALWHSHLIFTEHLDYCTGSVSRKTCDRLRYVLENPSATLPGEWCGSADPNDPLVMDDRAFLQEQTLVYDIPVERYSRVWNALASLLTKLDIQETETSIALRREIEALTATQTLSPKLVTAVRVAGDDPLDLANIDARRVRAELIHIDAKYGAKSIEAQRARMAFIHSCFKHTLSPEILSLLEEEMSDSHPHTGAAP